MATKVYVLPVPGREAEIERIKAMIAAAGCEVTCANEPRARFADCIAQADVLVVLICPETMRDPVVAEAVDLASRLGKRIVGIWSEDAATGEIPQPLHEQGDAVIQADPDSIAESVCQPTPEWTDPEGEPRPPPKTPRHKGKKKR